MVRQNRGGFPGGRPPPGASMAVGAIALLGGGLFILQNSLFNVDGGHRAIKYRRISGVSKEIYTEGSSHLTLFGLESGSSSDDFLKSLILT